MKFCVNSNREATWYHAHVAYGARYYADRGARRGRLRDGRRRLWGGAVVQGHRSVPSAGVERHGCRANLPRWHDKCWRSANGQRGPDGPELSAARDLHASIGGRAAVQDQCGKRSEDLLTSTLSLSSCARRLLQPLSRTHARAPPSLHSFPDDRARLRPSTFA